jgi:hypothetical protein
MKIVRAENHNPSVGVTEQALKRLAAMLRDTDPADIEPVDRDG